VRVFCDTSGFLALLDEDESRHREAVGILEGLAADRATLVTHNYVLVETIALVDRRLGRASLARLVDGLLPLVEVSWVDAARHDAALRAHRVSPRRTSFVDQVSFALMRESNLERAFAFDDDFVAEGLQLLS
jgi:predicted nucleic acid-binding protein